MYEALLSSEVSVRYGIGSSSLLSDENPERNSNTNNVYQRYVENRKKNLKFLPKISVYESFSQACKNNKSILGHYGP